MLWFWFVVFCFFVFGIVGVVCGWIGKIDNVFVKVVILKMECVGVW